MGLLLVAPYLRDFGDVAIVRRARGDAVIYSESLGGDFLEF